MQLQLQCSQGHGCAIPGFNYSNNPFLTQGYTAELILRV